MPEESIGTLDESIGGGDGGIGRSGEMSHMLGDESELSTKRFDCVILSGAPKRSEESLLQRAKAC